MTDRGSKIQYCIKTSDRYSQTVTRIGCRAKVACLANHVLVILLKSDCGRTEQYSYGTHKENRKTTICRADVRRIGRLVCDAVFHPCASSV